MRRLVQILILIGLLIWLPSVAIAAPFLVCDPQAGVTSYKVTGLPFVTATAQADGSIHADVAMISSGNYNVTIQACLTDPPWEPACSDPSPAFVFTRPSAPAVPRNVKLTAQ